MTRAKDISKIVTDADLSGTLDVTGDLTVDTNTLHVDSANNRVGVGTASPSYLIDAQTASGNAQFSLLSGGDLAQIRLTSTDTAGTSQINFADADSSNIGMLQYFHSDNHMEFTVNSTEAMRIDSSGNLLVGGTSAAEAGSLTVYPTGIVQARVIGNNAIIADRTSTDGEIIDLRKDGSTVGSIGVTGSGTQPYFVKASTGGFKIGNDGSTALLLPVNADGSNSDGGTQLGVSTNRFKDLYLSGKLTNDGTGGINIDTSGNVGIGTTSPSAKLEAGGHIRVTGGNNCDIEFQSGSARRKFIGGNGNELELGTFSSNNTSRDVHMRIDSGGRVGIGTDSPRIPLDIYGAGATTGGVTSHVVVSDSASYAINVGGRLTFEGKYNTAGNPASWASVAGLKENATDGNYAGYLSFSTRANGANQTERMRIDSNGDVGIGTTNAFAKLVVEGDNNSNVAVVNAIGTSPNYIFDVRDDGTSKFRVDGSGNVGIGITPSRKLHVGGTGSGQGELHLTNDTTGHGLGDGSTFTTSGSDLLILQRENANTRFYTNGTEAMRIDSSGNVHIGGTTENAGSSFSFMGGGGDSYLNFNMDGRSSPVTGKSGAYIWSGQGASGDYPAGSLVLQSRSNTGRDIIFVTGSSPAERMRIDSNGRMTISSDGQATYSTTASLEVRGQQNPLAIINHTQNADEVALRIRHDYARTSGQTATMIQFLNNSSSETGTIKTSLTATSFNTSSDHRLKENVVEMTDATTRLKQLQPKRFNFIADADTTVDGFLAHEVQSVVPEAITGTHNEVDADGNPVYQGIDHSKLVPLLVKTIQELEARIVALETA